MNQYVDPLPIDIALNQHQEILHKQIGPGKPVFIGKKKRSKMMGYTKEKWYISYENSGLRVIANDENCSFTIAYIVMPDGEEKARRIVACVNACANIPTEELEHAGQIESPIENLRKRNRKLEEERDMLLESLKEVVAAADGNGWEDIDPLFSNQRNAIAKIETGR